METKRCKKCGEEKTLDNFSKLTVRKDGYLNKCKKCDFRNRITESNSISNLENEVWKDVIGYEGTYEVSNLGRVKRSLRKITNEDGNSYYVTERLLKPFVSSTGYYTVQITPIKSRKGYKTNVHQLVCKSFHTNPENKPCVNHIDGNIFNNNMYNLEWVTYRENSCHSIHRKNTKKSKYVGVSYDKKYNFWISYIQYEGKHIHLGCFKTEIEAAMSYNSRLEELGIDNKYRNIID